MRFADLGSWTLFACALLLATPSPTRAQSQEEKRRQLQELLGIKKPAVLPARAEEAPDTGAAGQTEAATGQAGAATSPVESPRETPAPSPARPQPSAARPRALTFVDDARPILEKTCASCHSPEGKAAKTKWVLRGGPEDYEATVRFVKPATAAQSPLLKKGTGATLHGGQKSLAAESAAYTTLLQWIEGGALLGKPQAAAPAAPGVASAPAPAPAPATGAPRPAPLPTSDSTSKPSVSSSPPVAPAAPVSAGAPPTESPEGASAVLRFAPRIHEQLLSGCASCHSAEGLAANSRYLANPDPEKHLQSVLPLVVPGSAATSILYQRAQGEAHLAGAVWEPGSAELALLAQWIGAGALGPQPDAAPAAVAAAPQSPATAPPSAQSAPAAGPPAPAAGPHAGVSLGTFPGLGSLSLSGRFDLNYERVNYNDHPFQSEGANALRSYHQFLFLTRQSAADPVTLTLEVLSLQFWEVGYRVNQETWPVKVFAKAGKVLVPFGGDPLFHHSYGGHAGFDQKVLPVVFAREGLTVNVQRRLGRLTLSGDAYLISGYRLRRADGLLNLQSDFAPLEDTRLGAGARLGGSWGPISVWYSPYFNTLGFGRRLFLQALDVAVWRPRGLPVLERFSLGAGLLRADVSGGEEEGYGGPGEDYYHFASYLQLRFHPTEWLYLQYRQGLRTFGNRRGLFQDSTDFTREDGSTHNVGVVARWRGASAGLFHYWNLEKADEAPDDFTRLMVAYEF
jgi:cytochrome c553